MPDTAQAMHRYYADRAPRYDDVYLKPERAADIAFLQPWLAHHFRGRAVLEVACGTGFWTPHVASEARHLIATDGTAEPLALAKARPGCERVEFALADAYQLPESLGRFDAAFAGLWFSHVPKARQASFLAGLHERLHPGSRVVLMDNNESQLLDFPITETDGEGNTFQHRRLADGSVHRVLKNFPDESRLRELLQGQATAVSYRMLDQFWLLSYETVGRA